MIGHTEDNDIQIDTVHGHYGVRVWGDESGVPVLALHGWLDNAASFDTLAPLLPELHWVSLDLPGHGFSMRRPPGVAYHFIDYAKDVFHVAEALEWEQFHIIGHSLGAAIGSIFAGTFPDKVKSLIMIDALGPFSNPPKECPDVLKRSIMDERSSELKKPSVYESLEQAIMIRQKAGHLSKKAAECLALRGTRKTEQGRIWDYDSRLRNLSPTRLMEEQVLAFISNIQCPSLLIRAEDGFVFHEDLFEQRCKALKGLQVEMLPGGHHLHLDHPEIVFPIIQQFLRDSDFLS